MMSYRLSFIKRIGFAGLKRVYRSRLKVSAPLQRKRQTEKLNQYKKIPALFFVICLFSLSCTHRPEIENRFQHIFQQGMADNLYNIAELLGEDFVLESEFRPLLPSSKPSLSAGEHLKKPQEIFQKFPPLSSSGGYPKILKQESAPGLLKIRTAKTGEKAAVSFVQENITIENVSFINEYQFLDYKTLNADETEWHAYLADLLGKVKRLKGFPDTIYYILPLFEGHHLVLYKVGPPDKIPYDELPIAKTFGKRLAVPLVGYTIEYCVADVIPDFNDRASGQYQPRCEGVPKRFAEYIRLNERKKVFGYEPKRDLFPRDFFNRKEEGEERDKWFYVRTVVKSPENKVVGHKPFVPSHLVEFVPAPGKLVVLDAGDKELADEDKIRSLFIPVEWMDYEVKRDSENLHPDFEEKEKTDIADSNLRYFKIQFDDLVENEVEYKGEKTLKSVLVTDNYFSFNMEITDKQSGAYLVKFAFFKVSDEESANYTPKQWFEEDSRLFFPSFSEKRKYYKTSKDHSEEDHDRFLRTTRFNPKAEEIKFYFSKQTPKDEKNLWVRELGRLAVDLLNSALQEAGKDSNHKIKVVLDDKGEDKELGDIRYNILNLIVSEGKTNAGLLGLGPNVANPITGEVVSATANVWVSNILSKYISVVRNYIRFHVYPPAWTMKPFSRDEMLIDRRTGEFQLYAREDDGAFFRNEALRPPFQTINIREFIQNKVNKKAPQCGDLFLKPLGASPFLHEKIESLCAEVTDFIAKKKEAGLIYDPENPDIQDDKEVESCAKKLAFLPILGVTLHEILHGFAQRHIFSASVDSENFYKDFAEMEEIFGNPVSDKTKELFGEPPSVKRANHKISRIGKGSRHEAENIFVEGANYRISRILGLDKSLPFVEGTNCHPHPPQYSSVMDYMNLQNPVLFAPGKLDIAALRFIYFDKVEKAEDGEFLHVPSGANQDPENPQKSILQTAHGEKLKEYKILCGGLKIEKDKDETDPNQPLCKKFDYGESPFEIALNSILRTNNYLMNGRNRYDSKGILSQSSPLSFKEKAGDLYKKWKELRDELLNAHSKVIEDYSFLNPDQINDYLSIIHAEQKRSSEFRMYYESLPPIFDYFKRLAFMPSKHCIHKRESDKGGLYSLMALEHILTEKKGEYSQHPENSRERLISCSSPVVRSWADENKKGSLVTEVGFFATKTMRRFLLRPKGPDRDDESSAFKNLHKIINEGPFKDIALEPDFGAEYYQELQAYMLEGMDLNPYLDEESIEDADIPRNSRGRFQLNRVLNYRIDAKAMWGGGDKSLFNTRWAVLKEAVCRLGAKDKNLELWFGSEERVLVDVGRVVEAGGNNDDYPFFSQARGEFRGEDNLLASFIKNHPATFHNRANGGFIVIPYKDTAENLPAQLFKRFNEFMDCIEAQTACRESKEKKAYMDCIENQTVCLRDIEEKKAYTDILLSLYRRGERERESMSNLNKSKLKMNRISLECTKEGRQ